MSVGVPGEPTEFGNGDWGATDVLTLEFGDGDIEGTWQFDIDLNGDSLLLTGADTEWDFDDDGMEDALDELGDELRKVDLSKQLSGCPYPAR